MLNIYIYKYVGTHYLNIYMYLVHRLRERSYLIVYIKLRYANRITYEICCMQMTIDIIIVM